MYNMFTFDSSSYAEEPGKSTAKIQNDVARTTTPFHASITSSKKMTLVADRLCVRNVF